MDDRPYRLILSDYMGFGGHRHADVEFCYCAEGGPIAVTVEKTDIEIKDNELLLIGPSVLHAYPAKKYENSQIFTGIVGVSFLKSHFNSFSKSSLTYCKVSLTDGTVEHTALGEALRQIIELYDEHTEKSTMLKEANLYKVCAYLLCELPKEEACRTNTVDIETLTNVERALDLIYYDYKKSLTIDEVAKIAGYGKSNFCKLFKKITGESFHSLLNKRRVNLSLGLLTETDMPISNIAEEVGFEQVNTYFRVFKEITDTTPGAYRASHKS